MDEQALKMGCLKVLAAAAPKSNVSRKAMREVGTFVAAILADQEDLETMLRRVVREESVVSPASIAKLDRDATIRALSALSRHLRHLNRVEDEAALVAKAEEEAEVFADAAGGLTKFDDGPVAGMQ